MNKDENSSSEVLGHPSIIERKERHRKEKVDSGGLEKIGNKVTENFWTIPLWDMLL